MLGLLLWPSAAESASRGGPKPVATVRIPRLAESPKLEDFLGMQPLSPVAGRMGKVTGFIQREPKDGAPSDQRTEVYLGYDAKNVYVVFVCFDTEPGRVRAHMNRRENVDGEEQVAIYLDTFLDHRRAYGFRTNPLGIQQDFIWTEGQEPDTSFDTVWESRGKRTREGYVVWMAIPFRSLRFPSAKEQTWGILLERVIPRLSERSFWPAVTTRIEGQLNQEGTLTGLEGISPGRNMQFVPYGVFRSFRSLDTTVSANPRFMHKDAQGALGLDAKFVVKDSIVVDATIHPDFSQVESDEPQATANQRFEVFFPEKRPFFLENSDFFQTVSTTGGLGFYQPPINFVFTRRIADPQFGLRLTGKRGPYAVGLLLSDDRSPGETVAPSDPLFGKRAYFAIARVSRDIANGSKLGLIYTDREVQGGFFNRVGGLDGRFKLNPNWVLSAEGLVSTTKDTDGTYAYGSAVDAQLLRSGRKLNYDLEFHDASSGFITKPGFFRRPDIRRVLQNVDYRFRPEGKWVTSWGPNFVVARSYDHSATRLDEMYLGGLQMLLKAQSGLGLFVGKFNETLRPVDYSALPANRNFAENFQGLFLQTGLLRQLTFSSFALRSGSINFNPPSGQPPFAGTEDFVTLGVTVRPITSLVNDNTYILDRLRDRASGLSVFTNHIIRSKWNYQFNKELSVRLILQYNALLSNTALSSLDRSKNFNADFLIAYLIHPGTALYIGYNSNLENIDRRLCLRVPITGACDPSTNGVLRSPNGFLNDGRVFFIKLSYLFRP